LLAPKKDVAGLWAIHAGEKLAVFGKEADGDAMLATMAEKERAAQNIAEADESADVVDGQPGSDNLFGFDDDGFAFLAEVGALGGNV
jgi:hypothetical protein